MMGDEKMTSAYENAMSDQQANNYTQQYPVVTHEVIDTPFQVSMDCKHVPEDSDYICWNCTIKIIDIAEAAEARVAQLEAERDELKRQLERAHKAMTDSLGVFNARPGCTCPICQYLAMYPQAKS